MPTHPSTVNQQLDAADAAFMEQAIALAKSGRGWVNPNPQVGCVIVRDGQVIGSGYHEIFGSAHAERNALADCAARGNSPEGSTVYVTLEPCSHFGKTPPCANALIDAGVARVYVGSADPNPEVAGKGVARLRDAGIDVIEGVCKDACDELNAPFFKHVTTKVPYVVAKYAMTLDGKCATYTGASKWITGPAARQHVHLMRSTYPSIMVGVGTVLADDPMLNARLDTLGPTDSGSATADGEACASASLPSNPNGIHQPTRIICDTHLRTPLDAQVVTTAKEQPTLIATSVTESDAYLPYTKAGCEVLYVPEGADGHLDMVALLELVGAKGIDGIYVEGGAQILGSLFDICAVDEVHAYIAAKIFGSQDAPSPVGGRGVSVPAECAHLERVEMQQFGDDILVRGKVSY